MKRVTEFTPRGKGRQSYCRACVSEYFREYYRKHKKTYVARATAYHQKMRALVRAAKGNPCMDCGKSYPYYVMDFDHREGEQKLCNVAELNCRRRMSVRAMQEELAKCDVVCANCHRVRTHERQQYPGRRLRLSEIRDLARAAKCKPCMDCGTCYPYYVMDFDHREGEQKVCNVRI